MVHAADSAEADCAVAARCKDMADGKKALSGLDCRSAADRTDVAVTKKSVGGAYAGACRSDSKLEMVVYSTTRGYAQDAAPQTPPCDFKVNTACHGIQMHMQTISFQICGMNIAVWVDRCTRTKVRLLIRHDYWRKVQSKSATSLHTRLAGPVFVMCWKC